MGTLPGAHEKPETGTHVHGGGSWGDLSTPRKMRGLPVSDTSPQPVVGSESGFDRVPVGRCGTLPLAIAMPAWKPQYPAPKPRIAKVFGVGSGVGRILGNLGYGRPNERGDCTWMIQKA